MWVICTLHFANGPTVNNCNKSSTYTISHQRMHCAMSVQPLFVWWIHPVLVLCVRSHCPYPLLCLLAISDLLTVETAADFYQTMSLLSAHLKKGKIVSTKEFMEVSNVMQDCQTSTGHVMVWSVHVVCTLPLVVESHPNHYNKHLNPSFTMHLTHTNSVPTVCTCTS